MKIEEIDAAEVGSSSRAKYAAIYTKLDALPAAKGLKLTFETKEEMVRFKNAFGTRYKKAEWRYAADFKTLQVALARAEATVPEPAKGA